ncbi:MAG: hypothetical protein ACYC7E_04295 [Armatimonadota bacterium]
MNKTLIGVLAAVMLCSSVFAAPVALTDAQLDGVSAGQSVFDYVFGSGGVNQASDNESTMAAQANFSAADNGSNAVTGTDNEATSALATDNGLANNGDDNEFNASAADTGANAVSGEDNTAIAVTLADNTFDIDASEKEAEDGSALATDNATLNQNQADDGSAVATDNGVATVKEFEAENNDESNVVVGEGNTQTIDDTEIEDASIEEGGMGQIAKEAYASNSFNVKEVEIDVEVDIEDSFNVTTNTLTISGQGSLTAIVNANSLDDQNIGVNVSITTASSAVPTTQPTDNGAVSSINGNALAISALNQIVLNNVVIIGGGPTILPLNGPQVP